MAVPTPDLSRWDRLQELFHHASELPAAERRAYLDAACSDDPILRAEVEELLALDTGGGSTIAARAVETAAGHVTRLDESAWIGRRVGAWRITGVLGHGGMGAVYEVERADGAYRQRAALKLMRHELTVFDGARRFAEERQILAQLEHPNIARLLDGGNTEEGLPFLVLELVEGRPIHWHAEEARLTLEARLRLLATAARAVHAAHRKLIVHRDLKPANILVDAEGSVKLLDFGIARLAERNSEAADDGEDILFSPSYASPEQVNGGSVSTAADVYALGAVLFELLTGRPPRVVTGRTLAEIRREVGAGTIAAPSESAPSSLAARLHGDLDAIVARATHPDPAQRYESAERFAADLEAYLACRPVSARPMTLSYRAGKHLRRNAWSSALVAVALAGLIVAMARADLQARRAERRFGQVRSLANQFLFDFHDRIRDLQGATKAREAMVTTALTYLESLAAEAADDRDLSLELAAAYDRVGAIQYQTGVASLGRPTDAQKSYRQAIAIRERLLSREDGNSELHRQQAESYLNLAGAELGSLGVAKVTESYEHGLEHGERARQLANPPGPEVLDMLARLYRARGLLLSRSGKIKEATENYQAALRMHEELAARSADPERSFAAAESRGRVALALYLDGRSSEAVSEYRATLERLRAVRAAHPENRRYTRALENTLLTFGGVLSNDIQALYDPAGSAAAFREALELSKAAAADTADSNAQRDLAAAHCQVAGALAESDPAEALREFETGIGILRRQVKQEAGSKAADQALLAHLPYYALLLAQLGRPAALVEARASVDLAESLAKADPNSMQSQRRKQAAVAVLADVQYRLGKPQLAVATMGPVLPLLEQGALDKISQSLLRERMSAYSLLARAAARSGDPAHARLWKERFETCAAEVERRGLGGPYPRTAREAITREAGLR